MHKTALVAFSKDPTRSEVKTRLSEKFSKADRVSIYTALLEDFLAELTGLPRSLDTESYLACHPNKDSLFYKNLEREFNILLIDQEGFDLGNKMARVMDNLLQEHSKVIVFGTDTPLIPFADVLEAIASTDWQVLIGPSFDGGYYSIGVDSSISAKLPNGCASLFEGVKWSTDNVRSRTISNCKNSELEVKELPPARDIDRASDLDYLIGNLDNANRCRLSRLTKCLESLHLVANK